MKTHLGVGGGGSRDSSAGAHDCYTSAAAAQRVVGCRSGAAAAPRAAGPCVGVGVAPPGHCGHDCDCGVGDGGWRTGQVGKSHSGGAHTDCTFGRHCHWAQPEMRKTDIINLTTHMFTMVNHGYILKCIKNISTSHFTGIFIIIIVISFFKLHTWIIKGSINSKSALPFGFDNGLAPSRWQAIT